MIKKKAIVFIGFLITTAIFCQLSVVWGAPLVKTEKSVYKAGEAIKVIFSDAPGNDSDWICIAPAGSPDTEAGSYNYMPRGTSQGSLLFGSPAPGKYEVRAYYNYRRLGYVVAARYAFSVDQRKQAVVENVPGKSLPLKTEKTAYQAGETINVIFSEAPGNDSDWISIVPAGSPDTEAGEYQYTPKGMSQGSLVFKPPAPGVYEARAYYNYSRKGYAVAARYNFSVGIPAQAAIAGAIPEGKEQAEVAEALPEKTADSETATPSPEGKEQTEVAAAPPEKKPEPEIIRQVIPPSGYTMEYAPVVSHLTAGSFAAALELADKNYQASQAQSGAKQDKHLKLLERGKIALAARNYDQCIADLHEAEKRFLTIEGTVSIPEGLGSLATDDTVAEYEPEMHEKLMIPPYLVLAYLGKGDFDGARVERNKTINRINQYIEENPERAYLENPFARLLSAVVYEMEGKHDDAKIEYRKMKWDDEITRLENKKEKATDLIVFVDVGMAPQKYEVKYGPATVIAGAGSVTLGFTYAAYNAMEATVENCTINVDGKPVGKTNKIYDLEKTIFGQYERNKDAMMAKLMARMTGKAAAQVGAQMLAEQALKNVPFGGLFAKVVIGVASSQWIAAEKADLRSWVTLPRQIHYLRINELGPGDHTLTVEYNGGNQTHKVTIEEGKIGVAYFFAAR